MDASKSADISSERETPDRTEDLSSYVDRKLLGSIFSGAYTDRCWVDSLQSYRDRLQVDVEEENFIRNLRSVLRRLKKSAVARPGKEFFGIEKSGESFSVYVDWRAASQPFGRYWFQIERIVLVKPQNILQCQIKIIRPISSRDFLSHRKCPHCGQLPTGSGLPSEDDPFNLSDLARQMQERFRELISPTEWWNEARPHLTVSNVVRGVKFCFLLMMAAITGTSAFVVQLLSLLNRTIHELGFFLRQATPFLMACLDMVNKCIGGFYLLLAMMWRDAKQPAPPQPAYQPTAAIGYKRDSQSFPYERRNVQRPYLSRSAMQQ